MSKYLVVLFVVLAVLSGCKSKPRPTTEPSGAESCRFPALLLEEAFASGCRLWSKDKPVTDLIQVVKTSDGVYLGVCSYTCGSITCIPDNTVTCTSKWGIDKVDPDNLIPWYIKMCRGKSRDECDRITKRFLPYESPFQIPGVHCTSDVECEARPCDSSRCLNGLCSTHNMCDQGFVCDRFENRCVLVVTLDSDPI